MSLQVQDPNDPQAQIGFSQCLFTIKDGKRSCTADAYLRPAIKTRHNLHVALNSHVQHILFEDDKDKTKAVGVTLKYRGKDQIQVNKGFSHKNIKYYKWFFAGSQGEQRGHY